MCNSVSNSERGTALVMALLVMVALSALAVVMMLSMNAETKIAGSDARSSKALNLAEAGAAEAIARIRSREVPDSLNPRMVTQIFLTVPGSVPTLGPDTTALATSQPAGTWLRYTTPGRDAAALTVTYKTDAGRSAIYRYDASRNPAIQTSTGMPIFQITSTGRSGNDTRRIVTEVVGKPIVPALLATVSASSKDVKLWCGADTHGPFVYNGMNHRADTPTGAGAYGPDPENYVGIGDLPSFWSSTSIDYGGNYGTVCCPPVGAVLENQPKGSFYAGPWSALSMTQAEFYEMAGAHTSLVPPQLTGITYLDNNNISQDRSGKWTLSNRSGEGLLYVDGDLTIAGDFTWRGLIYVEGKLDVNGNTWVLGGVVTADPDQFAVQHVRATFLYSKDAIAQTISARSKSFYNLSWREVR
jgi:Tfp pilus assembly protein PilX